MKLRGSSAPRRLRAFFLSACFAGLVCALLAVAGIGLLVVRLGEGPITIGGLGEEIARALDQRFGHGYAFTLGETSIVNRNFTPTLSIDGLSLRDPHGQTVLSAPRAEVAVDLLRLVTGEVTPKRLEIFDVELRFALRPDGSLVLPAVAKPGEAPALTPPSEASTPTVLPRPSGATAATAPPGARVEAQPQPRALLVTQIASAIRLLVDSLTNPESPIAAVDRIGIDRGRLVIDDEAAGQVLTFNGVKLGFDKTPEGRSFNLSVEGPNGRWTAYGLASGLPDAERKLMLSLNNISLDEILIATGSRSIGADFDTPLSTNFRLGLDATSRLTEAAGEFEFGSGYWRFDDPNDEPMMVDKISGGFHWDGANRRIIIDRTGLVAGATQAAVSGYVAVPHQEGDPWTLALANVGPMIAAPERIGQKTVVLDQFAFSARLFLGDKLLVIDRLDFGGPEGGAAIAGAVDWTDGPHIKIGASMSPTPAAVALRLWPSFMVAPVRSWLLDHAKEGVFEKATLQVDFDAPTLTAMRSEHAPPDESVLFDFTISGGAVEFLPGVPPLRGIEGVGHVTGRTSTFTLTSAGFVELSEARRLSVAEGGSFHVGDSELKPTPAPILAKVTGSVEAVTDILSYPALKPYASLSLDNSNLKGQVDGALEVDLRLGPNMGPADVSLIVNATVTNFSADNILGKERLEGATLTIAVDPEGLRASGQGRMFGAPATIEIIHPKGKTAEASVRVIMDEAARAKQGLGGLPGLSGPIGAAITAPLGGADKPRAEVELDLTRAAIDLPGVVKPPGRPAKAKFTFLAGDNATMLDPFVFESGSMLARGQVELGADHMFQAARFPQAKISPGDDMKIDAVKAGEALKFQVRASALDAAPFLKWLTAASPAPSSADAGDRKDAGAIRELEFDVKATVLSGHNRQAVTGAELRLMKRGDQIRQFSFAGRFGRDAVSGNLSGAPGATQINLLSDDAGSFLSFFDFYRHMDDGRLSVGIRLGPAPTGVLTIDSFVLRDEPALRRLVAESIPPPDASGRRPKIDAGAMAFTRLQAKFQRVGSRLQVSDGTMFGDAIGLTVDGWLDYAHDKVDMRGTFVPAYAVNNLFSKIPVFGAILGGGSNEGLFGVNYRIEGSISSPTLSINPLSAIAPGIFRQIFGVGGPLEGGGGLR